MALIGYPWQKLGYEIAFLPGQAGFWGNTFTTTHRIEIYVRPDESVPVLAHFVAHEIGHAVDATWGTASRRQEWLRGRGIDPNTAWFGCSGCTDYQTPAGDFAETFAYWQTGPVRFLSRMAPAPSADQLAQLAPLFAGAS